MTDDRDRPSFISEVPEAPRRGGPRAAGAGPAALTVDDYVRGVREHDRAIFARAITLIESTAPRHAPLAQEVLNRLLPHTGGALRVGITGVPGVGKSSLIEKLGLELCEAGHRLAVLAVDPTSPVTRGSLLGDKTRMVQLSAHENAFIRPSPAAGTLGGVARRTRETILLCEAAGYDVVLVETVGVGQSEVTVHSMVDSFVLLLLAGGGDELQGIKKGVVELADLLAITKADGDNVKRARRARVEYQRALHFLAPPESGWQVPVLTCSARSTDGLSELWEAVEGHVRAGRESGHFERRRRRQNLEWMHTLLDEGLRGLFFADPEVARLHPELEAEVEAGRLSPMAAVQRLLEASSFRRP